MKVPAAAPVLLLAALITSAAAAPSPIAIKCIGTITVLPDNSKTQDTRIYIIDDKLQAVFLWDSAAQASLPICVIGECPKKFGANQIRVLHEDSGGSMILDIERDTGAIMHLNRSSSPARMETFEATCSKTVMPRLSGVKKF